MKKYVSLENLSRFYTKLKGTTLDTLEEIQANKTEGKISGALAVKELNNNLPKVVYLFQEQVSNSNITKTFDIKENGLYEIFTSFQLVSNSSANIEIKKNGKLFYKRGGSPNDYMPSTICYAKTIKGDIISINLMGINTAADYPPVICIKKMKDATV